MKRKMIIIALLLFALLGVLVTIKLTSLYSNLSFYEKFELNERLALLKPTVHLNYQVDIDEIKEVELMSFQVEHADKQDDIYTDKKKIKKIIGFLNKLPLAKATKDELPNKSADAFISIYDTNGREIGTFIIYGQIFIKDLNTDKLYRSKRDWIIEGLEKLDSKF